MAGVAISCCVLSMSQATLRKDLLEDECLSLILKINLNVHIQPGTWCNWTELLCYVPLGWGSYELMNYYKLTMVIIPPAASVSSVFLSRSSALACPTTLTTRPVKQHQTGIRSSKSKPSGLSDDTNHTPCQTTSNTYQVKQVKHLGPSNHTDHMPCQTIYYIFKHRSGQASRASWLVQPRWPHALSNYIHTETCQAKTLDLLGLSSHIHHTSCQTTLNASADQVKHHGQSIHTHTHQTMWNTSGWASWAPWPVWPHWPHALSNNIHIQTHVTLSGQASQAPWPVQPHALPNNFKQVSGQASRAPFIINWNVLLLIF